MTDILKEWRVHGLTCKLWKESEEVFRGCVFSGSEPVACAETLSRHGMDRAVQAVEALVPVVTEPSGPFQIDDVPIVDLVLVPLRGSEPEERLREPVQLASDMDVRPVSWEQAKMIYEACDPPWKNKGFSADLRGRPLYAISRYQAPRKPLYRWDPDERLQMCIVVSRFIRVTSISFAYAVRVIGDLNGRHTIVPGPVRDFGASAWTSTPERDWLSRGELEELRDLLQAFSDNRFPPGTRLAQAMWYFEYAARTHLVDMRYPLIATAVETLLSSNPTSATRHFTKRLPQLAERLDLPPLASKQASRLWGLRSAIVHGAKHGGLGEEDLALYSRMEEIVRETLRQAVRDPSLRAAFEDAESLNAAFPVPDPEPRS
jgi:hypothetical protein